MLVVENRQQWYGLGPDKVNCYSEKETVALHQNRYLNHKSGD